MEGVLYELSLLRYMDRFIDNKENLMQVVHKFGISRSILTLLVVVCNTNQNFTALCVYVCASFQNAALACVQRIPNRSSKEHDSGWTKG